MKKILICAAGGSPSTNFVRSVRAMKEPVYLVGVDADKYNLQRAETDVKLLVPRVSDSRYLMVLNTIIEEYGIEFIHIQNDYEIEFLSAHRDEVKAKLFLPAKETVKICLDKFQSFEAWKRAGILVPGTQLISSEDDLKSAFSKFGPKVWLRDIKGAAGKGSFPTDDYQKAIHWMNLNQGWGHFTAAECLTENSVTWMSIWNEGELIVAQGRKRMYWELGNRAVSGVTGVTGAGVTYSNSEFDELAQKVILAIDQKPHGIFSVDMTYDKNGIPNPTEINIGRFFTTHYFFTKAGLNMPEIFIRLAYGELLPPLEKKLNPLPDGFVWIRGMDFEPILTTMTEVEKSVQEMDDRMQKFV